MYKFHTKSLPAIFDKYFIHNRDIHQYETRQKKLLCPTFYNRDIGRQFIKHTGANLWNSLLNKVEFYGKPASFKRQTKEYLLMQYVNIPTVHDI